MSTVAVGLPTPSFLYWLGVGLEKFGSSGSAGGYFPGTLLLLIRNERPVGDNSRGAAEQNYLPPENLSRTGPVQGMINRLRMITRIFPARTPWAPPFSFRTVVGSAVLLLKNWGRTRTSSPLTGAEFTPYIILRWPDFSSRPLRAGRIPNEDPLSLDIARF